MILVRLLRHGEFRFGVDEACPKGQISYCCIEKPLIAFSEYLTAFFSKWLGTL